MPVLKVLGVSIAAAALVMIGFITMMTGMTLAAASLGIGQFGPWLVLGLYLVVRRPPTSRSRDWLVIGVMALCVVQAILVAQPGSSALLSSYGLWLALTFALPAAAILALRAWQ